MIISVIRVILSGIVLCREIVSSKIKEEPGPAIIVIDASDDLIDHALHHQLFDDKKCADPKTTAPVAPAQVLWKFRIREIGQEVRVRVHHGGLIFTLPANRCPLGDVVFFIRLIDPVILIVDIDHIFDLSFVDFAFDFRDSYFEIIIHTTFRTSFISMYTYSIIITKTAREINRIADFSGFFSKIFQLSAKAHWKLRKKYKDKITTEIENLQKELEELRQAHEEEDSLISRADQFKEHSQTVFSGDKLTRDMVVQFIDTVYVYDKNHIEVRFLFHDLVEELAGKLE